jgi:hypothetical protein
MAVRFGVDSELFHPGDSSRCTKIGLRLSSCRLAPRG